jgi:hypothetical protein
MQPLFDSYFGLHKAARRTSVCAVGIEANPHHSPALRQLERVHKRHGMRLHYLTETAVATRDGTTTFFLQNATKSGRAVHEWGASVFQSSIVRCTIRLCLPA